MSELLQKAYSPEHFREQGHLLIDYLADYLSSCTKGEELAVLTPGSPEDFLEHWHSLPKGNTLLDSLRPVLENANHLHHPRYAGHQVVPPVPMAALAELVSDLLNNGMAIYEMGPSGTMIERETIEWLGKYCGYTNPGGFLTSGGTVGNLTALLAARQQIVKGDVWKNGIADGIHPAVMVSEQAHYSIDRAVRVMGWGEQGIVKVPAGPDYRTDIHALEDKLAEARAQGKTVIALVGSAGTTATGTYDDLNALADFAAKHKLWFHVDGAHGGAVVLSDKYRHLAAGLERADSVVIDFHKMLLTPALTTAVIFREADRSYQTFAQDADYLLGKEDRPWYDSAARTLECTKKMMGVKIHVLRRVYGDELFRDYIDGRYDMTRKFARLVNDRENWETATEPMSNILCFRFAPPEVNPDRLNDINEYIRACFRKEGKYYIVRTRLNGVMWLRMTVMNPFTSEIEMNAILDHATQLAREFE